VEEMLIALLMIQERGSSSSSLVAFVFLLFSCNYGTQMNKCFTKSKYVHLSFTFFYVLVSLDECLQP
jgi:hypothetical protein